MTYVGWPRIRKNPIKSSKNLEKKKYWSIFKFESYRKSFFYVWLTFWQLLFSMNRVRGQFRDYNPLRKYLQSSPRGRPFDNNIKNCELIIYKSVAQELKYNLMQISRFAIYRFYLSYWRIVAKIFIEKLTYRIRSWHCQKIAID